MKKLGNLSSEGIGACEGDNGVEGGCDDDGMF